MLQSKKMTKTIQDYKEETNIIIMMLIIIFIFLFFVSVFSEMRIKELEKELNISQSYINLIETNGTIHFDSYYLGRDDGVRQSIKSFTRAIQEGYVIYYLMEDNKTIASINLSSCVKK